MQAFDRVVIDMMTQKLCEIEDYFGADAIFYLGAIHPSYEKVFRDEIETLRDATRPGYRADRKLIVILNTGGGSGQTAEKMVQIIRYHYDEVYFIVPDYAMSAGTILCMSGDKIYMDYSSSLGPIDPQVVDRYTGKYVPALGYLDKIVELVEKSRAGILTEAEMIMLQQQDLGTLRSYEQARDLSISLLKTWLVQYKFKDWSVHRTDTTKLGQPVTVDEKNERAESIARDLGNNNMWHSHGRFIGVNTLTQALRLEIEDYSANQRLRALVRDYNDMITGYINKHQYPMYIHSRASSSA